MRGMLRSFTVEGLNLERLVQQAAEQGIELLGMRRTGPRRMTGCIQETSMPLMAALAQEGGWQLRPGGPRGWARVTALAKRRWLICALCAIAVITAGLASAVAWRVELLDAGAYEADIRIFLAEQGIDPPMWKRSIDVPALRDALEWRYPRIAWIECGWRGGALRIRAVEGAQGEDPVAIAGCADMVASRAGVVTSVVTLAGTACVRAGQTVRKGEVLIRGEERGADGSVHPVSARGQVLARVWDGASVCVSGTGVETTYTGRESISLQVVTPWFPLWEAEASPYAAADVTVTTQPLGGIFLPVWLRRVHRAEAEHALIPLDAEEIRSQAASVAMRKLQEKVGFGQDFVDKWIDYSMIENGDTVATAIGERLVDIAVRASP